MSPEVVGRRDAACSPVPSGGGLVENRDFVLREWLATDEAISLVERAAAGLFREITVRGLWRALAGFEDGRTPLFDEALGELRSELVLFLCERTGLIRAIAANIENRPQSYLKAAFLNYLIDKSRNPKADPYRYLYKRTADCCRRSEDISLSSGPAGGLFMSIEPAAFQAAALSEEDLARVSFPESMIHACDIESLGKKRVLLPLSVHFVAGTTKLFGRPDVGVAVRDFIAWLAMTAHQGDYALVQGDFGATYLAVRFAFKQGLIPVYSTTQRQAEEEHLPDGSVRLVHRFEHCMFRRYGV